MYTNEQTEFINYSGTDSLILAATAGSGKTHSTVGRLNKLLKDGVDPKKMIFFSFTNDAVDELKSRVKNDDIKITTIHAFTYQMLAKLGKYKGVATFTEFIVWYSKNKRPKGKDTTKVLLEKFDNKIDTLWEEFQTISSKIAAFKLQQAENIKTVIPDYFMEYQEFLRLEKKRDFSDMLIEAEKLSHTQAWKDMYQGIYDYVFVDEYQDTSTIQMRVLLNLKAKQYHLIGDKNQAIYGFSGTSCAMVEKYLMDVHPVIRLSLSTNFRSKKNIVENANRYSKLKAVPSFGEDGIIGMEVLNEDTFWKMIKDDQPLAVLVRTNKIIKKLERFALLKKYKMQYSNYLSASDIEKIKKNEANASITKKVRDVLYMYGNKVNKLVDFIEENQNSNTFITTIHKSKGREYPRCVVVNSFDPEMLDSLPVKLSSKEKDFCTYIDGNGNLNQEALNIHYVAVTRPKDELYFLFVR